MIPELLSPAGSPEALRAAVHAGADAVYIGGQMYNARINASNFSIEEIKNAAYFCHSKGARLHVAVNTLIYDREIPEVIEYVGKLYDAGADALICADLGLCREIHRIFPDIELHASTQLSGHNSDAAKALADIGFSRMVCAREMSCEGISRLCENSPIAIEMFIHGALCVSHSGQCLMSSFIGGRSGNRGLCAQPCRMPYNGGYPLSLKDMCLAGHIPEILKTGVASLKIEGRMKSSEYVYGVTRIYRRLLDERRSASQAEMSELASLFSRSGFTDGYFTGTISKKMNGIRTQQDKRASARLKFPVIPQRQLAPIPAPKRTYPSDFTLTDYPHKKSPKCLSARFYNPLSVPASHPFDIVYLPLEKYDAALANGVLLPPVIYERDKERIEKALEKARQNGASHLMVSNIGQFEIAKKSGMTLHGDFRLNAANQRTAAFLINELGLCDIILSPELTLARIRDIIQPKSVIVYGRVPLMLLEKRLDVKELRDRKNVRFPVIREGGRDIILNSQITYMLDRESDLKKAHINNRHFIFTTETAFEAAKVIESYYNRTPSKAGIKRIK